jgi:hypothetical protein
MEVNSEPHGRGEGVESPLEVSHMLRDGPDDDEGVIGVLEDGTRKIVDKRVEKEPITRSLEEKLLENISNDSKNKGGQGISLLESSATLDLVSTDAI